jgi:hypothetical protein
MGQLKKQIRDDGTQADRARYYKARADKIEGELKRSAAQYISATELKAKLARFWMDLSKIIDRVSDSDLRADLVAHIRDCKEELKQSPILPDIAREKRKRRARIDYERL